MKSCIVPVDQNRGIHSLNHIMARTSRARQAIIGGIIKRVAMLTTFAAAQPALVSANVGIQMQTRIQHGLNCGVLRKTTQYQMMKLFKLQNTCFGVQKHTMCSRMRQRRTLIIDAGIAQPGQSIAVHLDCLP